MFLCNSGNYFNCLVITIPINCMLVTLDLLPRSLSLYEFSIFYIWFVCYYFGLFDLPGHQQ